MARAALVTATSLALTGAVVAHAYLLKHQFYPTVVYLTKSSPSMAVRAGFGAAYIRRFNHVFHINCRVTNPLFLPAVRCCTFRPLCWCSCWESS